MYSVYDFQSFFQCLDFSKGDADQLFLCIQQFATYQNILCYVGFHSTMAKAFF